MAKRVAREMSIGGQNYDSSIIPVRSDISRFSRGTDGQHANQMTGSEYPNNQSLHIDSSFHHGHADQLPSRRAVWPTRSQIAPEGFRRDSKSINVQIVSDHNVAVVGLTDLLEQLFFASCFSALGCSRLITAWVRTMVENQHPRLSFVSDLGEFLG